MPVSPRARTARPFNLPDGVELLTTQSTLAPRGIRVRPCTTTGEISTPVKRSPARNRAVSMLLLMRTLSAVPAGATASRNAGGAGHEGAGPGAAAAAVDAGVPAVNVSAACGAAAGDAGDAAAGDAPVADGAGCAAAVVS